MASNAVPSVLNSGSPPPPLNTLLNSQTGNGPHLVTVGPGHGGSVESGVVASQSQPVVKKTSFQITSVTTIDSSASNDGGDGSGDDLDESHTEDSSDIPSDVSSRHTSESRGGTVTNLSRNADDNFSRNDVFFNPSPVCAMGSAPVIPTSAQYGLAVVNVPTPDFPATNNTNGGAALEESSASATTETSGQTTTGNGERSEQERDHVHNRFKVVKIESTEPFRKGRWMCMDYFDQTTTTLTPASLPAATTNRIAVVNGSPNPALTPGSIPQAAEAPPPQQQTQSMSPPQVHQQQMIPQQTHATIGSDSVQHQQQQQQVTQSLGHAHSHQIQKPTFLHSGTQEAQTANHFQNQQELSIGQSGGQIGISPQQPQQQTNYVHGQQQPPPQQPAMMMMTGLGPMHQQQHHIQHVQPMQIQVSQQSQQAIPQNPTMYAQQNQMQHQPMQMQSQQQQPPGIPMAGQMMGQGQQVSQLNQQQFGAQQLTSQQIHPLIQQNQQQQQPSPQKMIGIPHQQPMVTQQPQQSVSQQQQGMLNLQAQMMNQGMQQQNPQMGNMMLQGHPPQQLIGQTPSGILQQWQQPILQTLQQPNYQPQQQIMNTQQMQQQQQPILNQAFQGQGQSLPPPQQHMLSTQGQQPTNIQQPQMAQQQQAMGGSQLQQPQQQQGMGGSQLQQPQQQQQGMGGSQLQQPQQGMGGSQLQQSQHGHPVHQLHAQGQIGMVVGSGQLPQYQTQPPQVQQQPTNFVPTLQQQSTIHPSSSSSQTQQQQGMGGNPLQQAQHGHSVHELHAQGQMGMVGQLPQQYQQQPPQVQQPTTLVSSIQQQPPIHPAPSANQVGLPINTGSSMSMVSESSSMGVSSSGSSVPEVFPPPGHPQQQQQQPISSALPPLGVNEIAMIQQQVNSVGPVVPLLPPMDMAGGPPGGDTSCISNLPSQARILLEESVVASDEGDSASGTSTVAIDNKIEQAMDLVKSHLMFAVREEVEVLKERIAELMERINHLEYENTIFRTNATPETLAQLQQSTSAKALNQSNPNAST